MRSVLRDVHHAPGDGRAPREHGEVDDEPWGTTMPTLATDAGRTDLALLDETIGANLARTVAAHGSAVVAG